MLLLLFSSGAGGAGSGGFQEWRPRTIPTTTWEGKKVGQDFVWQEKITPKDGGTQTEY